MKNEPVILSNCVHHGIVLDVSSNGFDRGSVISGSIVVDDDSGNIFLFYSGAEDVKWSRSAIGLAVSNDGLSFRKMGNSPVLDADAEPYRFREAVTPAVTRVRGQYYMVFSGRPSSRQSRRICIAYAEDLAGPWSVIGELVKPTRLWEGIHIDNGPSLVRLDETTFLLFYSSLTTPSKLDILAYLKRYPIRKIGLAKVRIRGPSLSQIEVCKLPTNPLKNLNGPKSSWNESVFCPGYFYLNGMHYLIPAASTYSMGFPYNQYIGMATSDTPYFNSSNTRISKLIDGPSEKARIMSGARSEIAIDSPCPLLADNEHRLLLYYSVADRQDYVWKTALTTFDLLKV